MSGATVDLAIDGLPGARFRFGVDAAPIATIAIPSEPFVLLVSRRRSAAWAREHATIAGEVRAAMLVLNVIAASGERRLY